VRETNGLPDESGELTFPEQFDDVVLARLHKAMGDYLYSCLYMNKPLRSSDMIFQPQWFKYYDLEPRDLVCYTTVDLAGDPAEQKGDPDWNVVMTCGKDLISGRIYVLDYFRARCSPSEVIHAIFDHVRKYKSVKVGIESVAYQSALIGWVRERMRKDNLFFLIEGITHGKRTKNSRIAALQPFVQAQLLLFRSHHRPLVTELLAFPLAAYDDLGDALSMQLPMWAMTKSAEEEKREEAREDPLSFDSAEAELEARAKRTEFEKTFSSPYATSQWSNN
jgi:predicted phage terminase large subunit-like protein